MKRVIEFLKKLFPSDPPLEELENIALGKAYTFSVSPNYPLCTDTGDVTDLTDGIRIGWWSNKGTVGWKYKKEPIKITVDLGKVEPVMGVAFNSMAGSSSIMWPSSIAVLVSEDNENFYLVGDLMELADEDLPLAYQGTKRCDFRTTKLRTKARYVRFYVIPSGTYTFCNEIEIYKGDEDFLSIDFPSQPTNEDQLLSKERLTRLGCYKRFRRDIELSRKIIQDSSCNFWTKWRSDRQLKRMLSELNTSEYPQDVDVFKAIIPFNNFHKKIFKIYASVLAKSKMAPITIWHSHPYHMLRLFEKPLNELSQLQVKMMQGECRSEVFNITNINKRTKQIEFRIVETEGENFANNIRVYQVEYVDTREGEAVASALILLNKKDGVYKTTVSIGMTRQIWLLVDSKDISPGLYHGRIEIFTKSFHKEIEFKIDVVSVSSLDYSDCSLATWDYVYDKRYGITEDNQAEAINDITKRPVDTVCCRRPIVPWPKKEDFDVNGNLVGTLNFAKWDSFVATFPGKNYLAYTACRRSSAFVGKEFGTESFERAISQWASAWALHNHSIGLKPKQVMILFHDEPSNEEGFKTMYFYSKAFKLGTSEILIRGNPTVSPIGIPYGLEMVESLDILYVRRISYVRASNSLKNFYQEHVNKGKSLWFGMSNGLVRVFNPGYYRLLPWYCAAFKANGSSFWAYGDNGGVSNWNEYSAIGRNNYTPLFIDTQSITTSKHWESACEGIHDYRCLQILLSRVEELKEAGCQDPKVGEAEIMVNTISREVIDQLHKIFGIYFESKSIDNPSILVDDARLRILEMLKSMENLT